jgi:Flp pilus assembly protein TadG
MTLTSLRSHSSSQSGVSLVLFAFFALILLMFAGLLIGLDGYYSAIQRLDAAGESGALASAQDLCASKFSANLYSVDRFQAINDVANLLNKNMAPNTAYSTQTAPADCASDSTTTTAFVCPTLTPGNPGTVSYCLDFPADSSTSGASGSVTLHMLWVVQQPFAGIVGPATLNVTSAQTAIVRINNPPAGPTQQSYVNTILADDPHAYWQLNESACSTVTPAVTAADSSTHNNPATYLNVSPNSLNCGVSGPLTSSLNTGNTALDETFGHGDGSRIHSDFTHADPLSGDQSRSVEMWFKYSSIAGNNVLFEGGTSIQRVNQLASSGDVSAAGILVEFSSGATTGVTADEVFVPTDLAIDTNNWHLLDVTLNGNAVVVYLDGIAATNGYVNSSGVYIANGDVACGGRVCTLPLTPNTLKNAMDGVQAGGGDGYGFDGLIDEVAVYAVALTPQQVFQHFAAR